MSDERTMELLPDVGTKDGWVIRFGRLRFAGTRDECLAWAERQMEAAEPPNPPGRPG